MGKPYAKDIVPGYDIIAVSLSESEFPEGPCRALWIGTAGNINITTLNGQARDDVPAQVGLFPIQCTKVRPGATATIATNIWAIY